VNADDRPRYLARASGYTHDSVRAIDPLECVTEAEQRELTRRAHEDERTRIKSAWKTADAEIQAAVRGFRDRTGHVPKHVQSGVRAVLRASEQVGRKLA
jgi:hypothetical protein